MLTEIAACLLEQFGDDPVVADQAAPHPSAVDGVMISHRWLGRAVFLLFRPGDRRPWIVAKVDRHEPYVDRLVLEDATLREVADVPSLRGLVPRPIGLATTPFGTVLYQEALWGVPLSAVVRRRLRHVPRLAVRDHAACLGWFERMRRWSEAEDAQDGDGVATIRAELGRLDEDLATVLSAEVARGAGIRQLARSVAGSGEVDIRPVRVHGDPGPGNLIHRGRRRPPGLIDWESGTGPHSPLPDGLTFINHYARVTPQRGRPPTRHAAVERSLLGDDHLGVLSRRTWASLVELNRLPRELAGPLALRTLVDLSIGRTGTAHSTRGRAMWTDLLTHIADRVNADPGAWERVWSAA